MPKKGLFRSLVSPYTNPDGAYIAYPGKPYHNEEIVIMPHKEGEPPLELDMVFMAYTEKHRRTPLLQFIKEMGQVEQRRSQHQDIKPVVEEVVEKPKFEDITEIEEPKSEVTLDELPARNHTEAKAELQQIAYDIDPVRSSKGFDALKRSTIKDLFTLVTEKRNLHAVLKDNSNNKPIKNEWISIALHGYTGSANKEIFQYNTRKWAKRWYTKKVLESLYKKKSHKFDHRKKVDTLFEEAWKAGWLKRDPNDIMTGL